MAAHPPSYTPTSGSWFMSTPKEVLVSKDPVFVRKDVLNGRYIGRKPPNYMLLALLVCILNPIVGPIALIFSIMSDRAYDAGDVKYADKWGSYAFTASMMIFIFSVILYVAIGFALSPIGTKGGHTY